MLEIPTQKNASKINSAIRGDVLNPYLILEQFRYTGIGTWKAVKASNTFTLTVVPSNGETVTIGTRVYTFKTALTPASGEVLIGANLAEAQTNLVNAVNGNPDVAGLKYASATRPNTQVSMSSFTANVSIVTALVAGTAGNSIATTETCANGVFSAVTLTGGLDEVTADGLMKPKNVAYNLGHTSGAGSSLSQNTFNELSAIGYEWAEMATNYDDLRYTTLQSKKFNVPNLTGSIYKRFAKVNVQAVLSEQITNFGVNPTNGGSSELDTNKFVISNGSNDLQVIQINADGSITKGTVFTHANPIHKFVCVDTGKIIGIRNVSTTQYGIMTFTVSGTTISFGTETLFSVTGSGTNTLIDIAKIATGKCAFTFRNNTTTFGVRIADFTGAISITASDTIVTPPGVTTILKIIKYNTDQFCLFIGQSSVATSRVYACTATGTAIAIGSAYTPTIPLATNTTFNNNFSAFAVGTTGIVFQAYNVAYSSVGEYNCFEQITMTTTVIAYTANFTLELTSTFSPSECWFYNTDTNKFVWYASSTSGINSRYNNANGQIAITFTVSGSTVTMSKTFRRYSYLNSSNISTEAYRNIKVGSYYVSMLQITPGTDYSLLISKAVSVDISNHETLMATFNITDPWLENTVDLAGLSTALINDDVAYLKIKNNDANTQKIKVTKALVEMES